MLALTPRGLALLFGSQAFVHHHQQDFQQVCARFEHVPYRALTLSACASAFQLTHCLMHTLSVPCIVSITNTLAATAPTPAAAWAHVYPNRTQCSLAGAGVSSCLLHSLLPCAQVFYSPAASSCRGQARRAPHTVFTMKFAHGIMLAPSCCCCCCASTCSCTASLVLERAHQVRELIVVRSHLPAWSHAVRTSAHTARIF